MATSSEIIQKDRQTRIAGGKEYTVDGNVQLTKNDKEGRIIVNDGTDDRVLMGQREDETYGMDISQSGADVKEAADEDMVLVSAFNCFKIVSTGTIAVTTTNGAGSSLAIHNFGYVPTAIVTRKSGSNYECVSDILDIDTVSIDGNDIVSHIQWVEFYTTSTRIYIVIQDFGAGSENTTHNFRYYLMREIAST